MRAHGAISAQVPAGRVPAGLLLAGLALAACAPARAADAPAGPFGGLASQAPKETRGLLDEARLGFYAHDPMSPEKGAADVNGELVFAPFGPGAGPFGALTPRLHLGGTLSLRARTSLAYAGFLWRLPLNDSFFLEASLGGALHDGRLTSAPGRNAMGCRGGFHESLSLGYRFAPRWSVLATIEHVSNAGLCDQNRGLTNGGLRLAYSF
jgi:hypothetical protein